MQQAPPPSSVVTAAAAFAEANDNDDVVAPPSSFTPQHDKEDGCVVTPLGSPTSPRSEPLGRTLRTPLPQPTLPELSDGGGSGTLCTVSLNLGGRNTNPVEFVLKGDSSETASELSAVLRKAKKNLKSAKEGPRSLLPAELQLIAEILGDVYAEAMDETAHGSRARLQELWRYTTWELVIDHVRQHSPHLFNALNLHTLKLKRPSVWEDPASCRDFTNSTEYLAAWRDWFRGLDRSSDFWQSDAPRVAKKRAMDVPTAFAGLLLFDVMCLCTARNVVRSAGEDSMSSEERAINFRGLAWFALQLPSSCLASRHAAAVKFVAEAHVLFAQEALGFAEQPAVVEEFLPPFCASDGYTSVFLRKTAFEEASDITEGIAKRMTSLAEPSANAWHSSTDRLAAVFCRSRPAVGGFTCCLVSLHCSRSDHTASFIETLRDVLADYDADINIVGMGSNCTAENVRAFQKRLVRSGFEVGCMPNQQQVTVAKQRTHLHTQVQKIGEVDVVHKDYIVSWASSRSRRGATSYNPDLRTSYGVEQETKQCVCLPTTYWPFDHCGVATTFHPRYKCKEAWASRRTFFSYGLLGFVFLTFLAPLAARARKNPYGEPGTWHFVGFTGTPRAGICEAGAPCGDGWTEREGSCYLATPLMSYMDAESYCAEADSKLVAITSDAENHFLTRSVCPEDEFCWIGMRSDTSRETQWWVSGEPLEFSRLVGSDQIPLPLFPMSRASKFDVVMLSNLPEEIDGCNNRFVPPLQKPPTSLALLNWWSPAFCTIVSLVVLLLPRPPHILTTVYLVMAFSTNLVWWLLRLADFCFASDFAAHKMLYFAYTMVDVGGKTQSSLIAFWIIIQRMKVLGSARAITAIFFALIFVIGLATTVQSLFIDTSTTFDGSSPLILLWVALLLAIVILYLVAAALISADLYSTWAFLHREATAGRSSQSGGVLNSEVRAAKVHFFSVFVALVSGGGRWLGMLTMIGAWTQTNISAYWWTIYTYGAAIAVDSVTNDLCAYLLAVSKMDGAVLRASGITREVIERAGEELEQHRIAVKVLKAAPTSAEQLCRLARLESEARRIFNEAEGDKGPFMVLQSAVRVETARIHWLMQCVRLRSMTMPVRYQYLMEVPALEGAPRQHVPARLAEAAGPKGGGWGAAEAAEAAAAEYFGWLYAEAEGTQQVLFNEVKQLLAKFNSTPWPTDLGLAREQFPWMIWTSGHDGASKQLQKGDALSPGSILLRASRKKSSGALSFRSQSVRTLCFALEEVNEARVRIHCSGREAAEEAPREELRACGGGAVFIPGPMKKRQRCLDKIATDYEGSSEWPAAASMTDLCRCMIVVDDPYAAAVLVAYIRNNMRVVRLKNRFSEDVLESRSPGDLQSMFSRSCSSTPAGTAHTGSEIETGSGFSPGDQQYRDLSMNVAVTSPSGVPVICEIQVTLANLAILKCAEQQLYTIRRMKSALELQATYVFSKRDEVEAKMAEM